MVGERAFPFIAALLVISAAIFLGSTILVPSDIGASFSAGLLSIAIPLWIFYLVYSKKIPPEPKKQLKRFYWAEVLKLLTFALLCSIFVFALPLKPLWFFGALVLGQFAYLGVGLTLKEKEWGQK